MKLDQIAQRLGARIVTTGRFDGEISRVYAGDRISDLLNHASEQTMLVTNLLGPQLLRLAELMDVPGICLVNDHVPDDSALAQAHAHGALLMVSSEGLYETCGRLYRILQQAT